MNGTFAPVIGHPYPMRNLPFAFVLFLFFAASASAQNGTISGTITEQGGNGPVPMPFANVFVAGTALNSSSDIDGNYALSVPEGTYTVVFSFIGYQSDSVANVQVTAGATTRLDRTMSTGAKVMKEFKKKGKVDREREVIQMAERKEATTMVQNIGAAEMKKKGAGDVAEGVTKMVGLSVVGSRYVVVRGLGDRYNAAYLNGIPLPSPDADNKVAPLDIFPTDVVSSIAVTKGFTPELFGDFSGGVVDIRTKRATEKGTLRISLGTSMNTQSTFKPFSTYNGGGRDFWGMEDGTRDQPVGLQRPGALSGNERLPFAVNWNTTTTTAKPDMNFGLFAGTAIKFSETVKLNLLGTANYRNEYRYRDGQIRIANASSDFLVDYDFTSHQYNTQGSALATAGLELGKRHNITLTTLYVNLSSDEVRVNDGYHFDYQERIHARRFTYRQNTLWLNQAKGEHRFGKSDRLKLNWDVAYSTAKGNEPDRRQLVYLYNPGDDRTAYTFNQRDRIENHRWYSGLQEEEFVAQAGGGYRLLQRLDENDEVVALLTVRGGWQMKRKDRSFGYDIYAYDLNGMQAAYPQGVDADRPDLYLDQSNYEAGNFTLDDVTGPEADHSIKQDVDAYWGVLEADIIPGKLKLMGGARYESGDQMIRYRKQSDSFYQPLRTARILSDDLLPYAAVKVDVSKKDIVRATVSKTISRPGFREMAPFEYTEVFAGTKNVGNPDLVNGTNLNADVRYERFANPGELFAVGMFGKQLNDPIEKVALATASGQLMSFRNTGTATVAGVEVEVVKNVGSLIGADSSVWNDVSIGLNGTLMMSEVDLSGLNTNNDQADVVLTNERRPLQGASPWLLNADIGYTRKLGRKTKGTATLAYNIFGRRVFAAGANGLGDQYELPVGTLHLIFRADVGDRWQANLGFRNLLNPAYRVEQETPAGDVVLSTYRTGTGISFGLTYRLF